MARKKVKLSKNDSERVKEFLELFSRESLHIRQELANSLPALNYLLGFNPLIRPSVTFEEIRLLSIAKEKGLPIEDPFFDLTTIRPPCPECGEEKSIRHAGPGQYICNHCSKKYAANWNSISSRSNLSVLVWMRFVYCLLKSYSVKDTVTYCGISPNTYYKLLKRVAYGMDIFLKENLKLYGKIQTDISFFRLSYKGTEQYDSTKDFSEGSLFDEKIDYVARKPRSRGGHIKMDERNSNYVAVITFVDEFGHIFNKYVNIGAVSASSLKKAVGEKILLPVVPLKDPFPFAKTVQGFLSAPGQPSLIITDGEAAIKAFAAQMGIECESHVYRKDGKQLRLPTGSQNIQKANHIHSRLKNYLRRGVSSEYLPAYLTIFNFYFNIPEGMEEKAIGALFEILARPDLGRSEQYYKDLYTPPNLWKQWSQENNPLRKFNENQLMAIYLYHLRRVELDKGLALKEVSPSVRDIAKKTEFTEGHIRRLYKNAVASDILKYVIDHFEGQNTPEHEDKNVASLNQKKKRKQINSITPELLAIYDEYAKQRLQDYSMRKSTVEFLKEMNVKYGINLKRPNFANWCKKIAESGLRPPLPKAKKANTDEHMDEYMNLLYEYDRVRAELVNKNKKTPTVKEVYDILSKRHGGVYGTINKKIRIAREERKRLMKA